jgi:hypothetical protein
MLNTHVTNLLDSSRGNPEDVPKVIEQLYGKVFIFQFRLNSYNLTEGRQGYVVRKTFVPDEKLEKEMFCTKNDEVTHEKNTDKELLNDKTNEVSFCNISIVYFFNIHLTYGILKMIVFTGDKKPKISDSRN